MLQAVRLNEAVCETFCAPVVSSSYAYSLEMEESESNAFEQFVGSNEPKAEADIWNDDPIPSDHITVDNRQDYMEELRVYSATMRETMATTMKYGFVGWKTFTTTFRPSAIIYPSIMTTYSSETRSYKPLTSRK